MEDVILWLGGGLLAFLAHLLYERVIFPALYRAVKGTQDTEPANHQAGELADGAAQAEAGQASSSQLAWRTWLAGAAAGVVGAMCLLWAPVVYSSINWRADQAWLLTALCSTVLIMLPGLGFGVVGGFIGAGLGKRYGDQRQLHVYRAIGGGLGGAIASALLYVAFGLLWYIM